MEDKELVEVLQRSQLIQQDMQNVIDKLTIKNASLTAQNETWNRISESDETVDMSIVAKLLNFKDIGRNKLFKVLRDISILRYNNEPYQQYVDAGYFAIIEQEVPYGNGNTMVNKKTVVTQKGIDYIRKKMQELGRE